jgi:uncharacterized membrane-anchored protein
MIYKTKRFSRADYEGLDLIGKQKMKKLRSSQAKDLKKIRSLNNKIMDGLDSHRITAHDLAQDAAKKTRKIASQKIREGSKKRLGALRKGTIGAVGLGATIAGGYGLKKLYDENREF